MSESLEGDIGLSAPDEGVRPAVYRKTTLKASSRSSERHRPELLRLRSATSPGIPSSQSNGEIILPVSALASSDSSSSLNVPFASPSRAPRQSGLASSPSTPNFRRLDTESSNNEGETFPFEEHTYRPQRPEVPLQRSSSNLARSRTMPRMRSSSADSTNHEDDPNVAGPSTARPNVRKNSHSLSEATIAGMQRWVQEVVVCNFDLDRGPVVQKRMAGRPWGKGEKENIAFSAFPDTSLFAEGSIAYSFKIREATPQSPATISGSRSYFSLPLSSEPSGDSLALPDSNGQNTPITAAAAPRTPDLGHLDRFFPPSPITPTAMRRAMTKGETADDYRKWDERGRGWIYGYVWFEQRRDKSIARGYMQRSVVILTHLPLPSLFASVLAKIAPMYFDHGYAALEAACQAFSTWPNPEPGMEYQLPLLSELIAVRLPDESEAPQLRGIGLPDSAETDTPLLASLPLISPLKAFAELLPDLWNIWECLVTGEPLLIIAPDPKTCSNIVWWLRDLIRPIPTANYDFRPYLHIHDLDFRLLVNSNKPPAGLVVGVTNPFFRNAAGHWPNMISVASDEMSINVSKSPSMNKPEHRQGFVSSRKRHVSKDRVLLKRLETLVAQGNYDDESAIQALRTHFIQLTEKMLAPLSRYVSSLVPPPTSMESVRPFSLTTFLIHLRANAPNPLQFKSKGLSGKVKVETDFYTAFCKGSGFAGWLEDRTRSLATARVDHRTHAQAMFSGSLSRSIDRGGRNGVFDLASNGGDSRGSMSRGSMSTDGVRVSDDSSQNDWLDDAEVLQSQGGAKDPLVDKQWDRITTRYTDAGYREGITPGKLSTLQQGFDNGFAASVDPSRQVGQLRARAASLLAYLQSTDHEPSQLAEVRALIQRLARVKRDDVLPVDTEAEEHARDEHLDVAEEMGGKVGNGSGAKREQELLDDLAQNLGALEVACGVRP